MAGPAIDPAETLRPGALSILREGRLQLLEVHTDEHHQPVRVAGRVRGHRGLHVVDLIDGTWNCTCPDRMYRGKRCAHVMAVRLVTLPPVGV